MKAPAPLKLLSGISRRNSSLTGTASSHDPDIRWARQQGTTKATQERLDNANRAS
eukprot:CAMPEP_0204309070 /NCGR_PEP_ID=MMETSP0469-20131031/887_1 /ASSEMBLY_ACC=CAM_ASM_000384 /TAXON_ID=2969 /ORGANISM="Oxyrrhis marina" /LENGTH=54 /DNA_ID=CAMNT_0051288647 /DNA_START=227 /DNA_END=387 /DNA_ORIENTATION=-